MNAVTVMNPRVIAVTADLTLEHVVDLLVTREISAVPVVDENGQVVGILGVEDLVRAHDGGEERSTGWRAVLTGSSAALGRTAKGRTVGQIMSRDVVTVEEDTPMRTLIELLARRRIKRVPVVHHGRLVGLITRADVLRALNTRLPRHGGGLDALLNGPASRHAPSAPESAPPAA